MALSKMGDFPSKAESMEVGAFSPLANLGVLGQDWQRVSTRNHHRPCSETGSCPCHRWSMKLSPPQHHGLPNISGCVEPDFHLLPMLQLRVPRQNMDSRSTVAVSLQKYLGREKQ